jgi:hypothetical protein
MTTEESRRAAQDRRAAYESGALVRADVEGSDIEHRAQLGRSGHYLRLGDLGNPTLTAAITAATEIASHNVPVAVGVGAAAEAAQRYRNLREDEKAVFDLLRRLARGGNIYKFWIEERDLLGAMDPELDMEARRRLLANMRSRGILEEGAGKWRAVW